MSGRPKSRPELLAGRRKRRKRKSESTSASRRRSASKKRLERLRERATESVENLSAIQKVGVFTRVQTMARNILNYLNPLGANRKVILSTFFITFLVGFAVLLVNKMGDSMGARTARFLLSQPKVRDKAIVNNEALEYVYGPHGELTIVDMVAKKKAVEDQATIDKLMAELQRKQAEIGQYQAASTAAQSQYQQQLQELGQLKTFLKNVEKTNVKAVAGWLGILALAIVILCPMWAKVSSRLSVIPGTSQVSRFCNYVGRLFQDLTPSEQVDKLAQGAQHVLDLGQQAEPLLGQSPSTEISGLPGEVTEAFTEPR